MWNKYKFLLLNIIPAAIAVLNAVAGSGDWPSAQKTIYLVVVILTAVLNAIGGTVMAIHFAISQKLNKTLQKQLDNCPPKSSN
jgi:hypothetical protein